MTSRTPANRLEGDLHTYHLTVDVPDVKVDLTLTGAVPAWRPGAGRITFGAHDEKYFAWLPSVPEGRVEGTLVTEGQRQTISGTGYHDHNWGNASMLELMHHWYWGRARVGPYSLIASHITPAEAYDPTPFTIFMLAKDDRLVADDARQVRFSAFEEHLDDLTLKPVAAKLVYDFQGGDAHYRVTFARHRDIVRSRFIDSLRGLKWLAAKLVGFDAAYLRFTGEVTVERLDAHDAVVEAYRNSEAIWELMYLGHAPSR